MPTIIALEPHLWLNMDLVLAYQDDPESQTIKVYRLDGSTMTFAQGARRMLLGHLHAAASAVVPGTQDAGEALEVPGGVTTGQVETSAAPGEARTAQEDPIRRRQDPPGRQAVRQQAETRPPGRTRPKRSGA